MVEIIKRGHDRQAANKLRDKSKFQEIRCLYMAQHLPYPYFLLTLDISAKSHSRFAKPVFDGILKTDECAATDKQDVCGIDLDKFLVWMFAPTLRGYTGDRPFDDFEQRLLDTFTGNIPCDRGVLALSADLIYLVNIDNAAFCFFHIIICCLQQLQYNILDIFSYITRLCQGRCIGYGERHVQYPGKGLGKECLAGPGRPDQEDVSLLELDIIHDLDSREEPFIVIMHRDRQGLFGTVLPDYIIIQCDLDFRRLRYFYISL